MPTISGGKMEMDSDSENCDSSRQLISLFLCKKAELWMCDFNSPIEKLKATQCKWVDCGICNWIRGDSSCRRWHYMSHYSCQWLLCAPNEIYYFSSSPFNMEHMHETWMWRSGVFANMESGRHIWHRATEKKKKWNESEKKAEKCWIELVRRISSRSHTPVKEIHSPSPKPHTTLVYSVHNVQNLLNLNRNNKSQIELIVFVIV